MSSVLYRLGRWCAAHAWRTLALWLVVLVGVGTLAATVGKPLTSQISIPGTEFEKVLDRLGGEIPEAAGGAGTVVLESGDEPFTEAQQAAVEDVFASWAEVPHVKRVTNPFEAQAQLDQSAADIAAAATTIEDGQRELDAGRATLGEGELRSPAGRPSSTSSSRRTPTTRRSPDSASSSSRAAPSSRRAVPSSNRARPTSPTDARSTTTARPSPTPPRAPAS